MRPTLRFPSGLAVLTTRCCTSLHVRSGLASRARATMPAAIGELALVPVCWKQTGEGEEG